MTTDLTPKVSFVVPCYKLAHVLADCVNSIFSQTFSDLEILIMDDSSPDNTPRVVRSLSDQRVRYIRNEENLGHLRNYNKGITLARGKYVWLISPDDRLRRANILQRYVDIMDSHSGVGYVFCPAVGLHAGEETDLLNWSFHGAQDTIFQGHAFLKRLTQSNRVAAPAVMARKECYEKLSLFPEDMPYAGDWYMWGVFALHYDVAYVAEPMVCYRLHDLNMTKSLRTRDPSILVNDDIAVRWRLIQQAKAAGAAQIVTYCQEEIIADYVRRVLDNRDTASAFGLTIEQLDDSLRRFSSDHAEESSVRARVYAGLGDRYYWRGSPPDALHWYRRAVHDNNWALDCWAKYLLIRMGEAGVRLRKSLSAVRRLVKTLSYASRPG